VESDDNTVGIAFARISVQETETTVFTNEDGLVVLTGLCPGEYHITLSQIGHESESILVDIPKQQEVAVVLAVHSEIIDQVEVEGEHPEDIPGQVSSTITEESIDRKSNLSLADLTEGVAGVSTLRTGSTIGKPIIHGMYGNRVAILNNGLVLAGQQWGNDHAPEIDINTAESITVVKGVDAIVYGGNALGGMVLINPGRISAEPHLHGKANYVFNSNGLGHSVSTKIEKGGQWARWRAVGTFKRTGDKKTPDYFLTNTGTMEANGMLQFEKNLSEKWLGSVYLSTFNSELATLRGSHIGNLTDLEDAIGRSVPLFTEVDFAYTINAPRQKVGHHTAKIELKHFITDYKNLTLTYGFQANNRKEFDIRRGNRTSIPAMDMQLFDNFLDGHYHGPITENTDIYLGIGGGITTNDNSSDTGILPLIPNYDKYRGWTFASLKTRLESGIRYEYSNQDVVAFERTVPISVVNYDDAYHNVSLAMGAEYESNHYSTSLNAGYTNRAPEINERFSNGLHQGVSGIEEGDVSLNAEGALKFVWSNKFSIDNHSRLGADLYTQYISDYIYLQPGMTPRLTIRGAFPVFTYEQTNASISGFDLYGNYRMTPQLDGSASYSYIRGNNTDQDIPLVYMPPNNLNLALEYLLKDSKKLQHSSIQVSSNIVSEQGHLNVNQDFLAPPSSYFLLNARAETELSVGKNALRINLAASNILNEQYRDYLNRLRYYADEVGTDVRLGLNFSF